jgi:putative ABC transport system substrate-binding protein
LVAFRSGLEVLGWKEGQTIHIDYRWPGADVGRARALAVELAGLAPAAIMCGGTVASTALHEATTTIPIVFVNVTDPVAGGFVESLARPGGNMTGFTPFEYEISGKWLQLLKEMAPGIKRVALLGDPNNHNFKGFQKSFESVAHAISVEPISVGVRGAEEIERGIRSLATEPNGGLIITAAAFSITHRPLIVALANQFKLPAIYWNRFQVAGGGLMSYGPDIPDLARQAATYVDRILKGAKPSELPVQAPIKLQLLINAMTAKAIDLAIPPALLARADEVIE